MAVQQQQDIFPEPKEDWAEAYRQHSTTLRNSFVLYGIGGLVFMNNEKIWDKIAESDSAECIGWAFLLGVLFQIVLSTLDKNSVWVGYYSKMNPPPQNQPAQ